MPSVIIRTMREQADQTAKGSVSDRFRRRRMELFDKFCSELGMNLKVADIGGTFYHWKDQEALLRKIELTLINISDEAEELPSNVTFVKADARALDSIAEAEFDVAYSNSVIEHFSTFDEQKLVAGNIMRIAKNYFVQTPNHNFPVEPHFLFPYFQMLPLTMKKTLVKKFALGWYEKQSDDRSAHMLVTSIRLLNLKELKELFPDSKIYREKFLMMNKSFIAYK
jgi:hypothetical protein